MGNCLKSPTADDISLLRGNDSQDGSEASSEPPPPYQVCDVKIIGFVYIRLSHASYKPRYLPRPDKTYNTRQI